MLTRVANSRHMFDNDYVIRVFALLEDLPGSAFLREVRGGLKEDRIRGNHVVDL